MKEVINGIAVLENDTHIGKWVAESGRLDHDQNMLPLLAEFIPKGGVVIDVGAYIGDHTVFYSDTVGKSGKVYAIEANPRAYECLVFNTKDYKNVHPHNIAIGDKPGSIGCVEPNDNVGMAYVDGAGRIPMLELDALGIKPDFIKFDIEGFEYKALVGAFKTIRDSKPNMLIEINKPALARQNTSFTDIATLLKIWGYSFRNIYAEQDMADIQFDIICTPNQNK